MSKRTIIILSATFLCLGAILFGGAMSMLKWNFRTLSTVKYETAEHRVLDAFESISVKSDTAKIVFEPSEDGQTTVVCHERAKSPHAVSVRDGVLTVELTEHRRWYDYIGLDLGSPTVTVRLPAGAYAALTVRTKTGDISLPSDFSFDTARLRTSTGSVCVSASVSGMLSVETGTGNVSVENLSAGALDLSVSTGRILVSDVCVSGGVSLESSTGKISLVCLECRSLTSESDTGSVFLSDVIAVGKMKIESDTGDVRLTRCDASDIDIETDTGSIVGTILSEKLFDAKSDTGRVRTPEPSGTERCRLRTDTGRIEIDLAIVS